MVDDDDDHDANEEDDGGDENDDGNDGDDDMFLFKDGGSERMKCVTDIHRYMYSPYPGTPPASI